MKKFFLRARAKRLFDRIFSDGANWSIPIVGGLGGKFGSSKSLLPSRIGVDESDRITPFVHDDPSLLAKYYNGYVDSIEFKGFGVLYAETIALKNEAGGYEEGLNLDLVEVLLSNHSYSVPPRLRLHGERSIDLFKKIQRIRRTREGEWENNQSVRLNHVDPAAKRISLSRVSYFDQIATNLTADWASGALGDDQLMTIREIEAASEGRLCSLRDSVLANSLGIAAVVVDAEGQMLVRIRGSEQAIMNAEGGRFHCSVSGVFELPQAHETSSVGSAIFVDGMRKEIVTELGLKSHEYKVFPIALSRELARLGKPQMFFVIETSLTFDEIEERAKNAEEAWEFIGFDDIDESSDLFPYLDDPSSAPPHLFTYEGKMALALTASYVQRTMPPFSI